MVFFLILRLETWLDMGILLFLHLFKFNSASSYLLPELKKKKRLGQHQSQYCAKTFLGYSIIFCCLSEFNHRILSSTLSLPFGL